MAKTGEECSVQEKFWQGQRGDLGKEAINLGTVTAGAVSTRWNDTDYAQKFITKTVAIDSPEIG
jgi:hypothetical protein